MLQLNCGFHFMFFFPGNVIASNPSLATRLILSYPKLKYALISQACPSIEEILRFMWLFYKEGIEIRHIENRSLIPISNSTRDI